jgi:hypothetical protein
VWVALARAAERAYRQEGDERCDEHEQGADHEGALKAGGERKEKAATGLCGRLPAFISIALGQVT